MAKKKACLQHTRFLYYCDKRCILKQILHVTSVCLNSFSFLVLMFASPNIDRVVQTIGITLYMGYVSYECFIVCGCESTLMTFNGFLFSGVILIGVFLFLLDSLYWRNTRSLQRSWRKFVIISPWQKTTWLVISSRLKMLTCSSTSRSMRFEIHFLCF